MVVLFELFETVALLGDLIYRLIEPLGWFRIDPRAACGACAECGQPIRRPQLWMMEGERFHRACYRRLRWTDAARHAMRHWAARMAVRRVW